MKVGMMPVWDKWGTRYGCTVLQLDDCKVVQVKTTATDGYNAVQLGVGEMKANRVGGLIKGHMNKWVPGDTKVPRKFSEFRVTPDCLLEPGTKIPALHFVPGQVHNFVPLRLKCRSAGPKALLFFSKLCLSILLTEPFIPYTLITL